MGADIGQHQEKGLIPVPAAKKIQRSASCPIGGMQMLVVHPGTGDPGIAFQAGIGNITGDALLIFQPIEIIVRYHLMLMMRDIGLAVGVQVAVVQVDVVKTHRTAKGIDMHLPRARGGIARFRQFAGHGHRVIPRHPVPIPYPAVMLLRQAGVESRPGGNAARASAIGAGEPNSLGGQRVQKRGLDIGMARRPPGSPPAFRRS